MICSEDVSKQHSFVILLGFCFGFLLYAGSTPEFESAALVEPLRMLSLVPVAAVDVVCAAHRLGEERHGY